jgi:hypothetical protein
MRRSRMFLSLTAVTLAVAGAIAVKGARYGTLAYYSTAGAAGTCLLVLTPCNKAYSHLACMTENFTGWYYTAKTFGGHCNLLKPLQYSTF